jgi:spore coat polysaccharide biosynthesis protein SpsF (cytidylyltransferase family)/aryl-alcohol dehydrogenase-like predicted oxidoreductase
MNGAVIMQARTTSSRLPGKALLPVSGYPSAVLAALRAANLGHQVILATSDQSSDDVLAEELCAHGVPIVRGPLEDVLARYVLAARHLSDESLVVRLTADNVVPDGGLIEELLHAFADRKVEYLSQESPQSGLPYGVGGEVFSVATLRRAHASATSSYDREHVTPWIRRNCTTGIHRPLALADADYSHLRCTVDDEEDYQRVCCLFEGVHEPVSVRWFDLVKELQRLPAEATFRVPYQVVSGGVQSEITLGTAQIGMEYGIANSNGKPSRALAIKMIRRATAHGVTAIDTARDYGDAEEIVREALAGAWRSRTEVVTKLGCLPSLKPHDDIATVRSAVEESVSKSCEALGAERLGTLLLHRVEHYGSCSGAVWKKIVQMRDEGKIGRVGVSVYEPQDALRLLADPEVRHLQIPMNAIDWRWKAAGIEKALLDRPDVIVHARSGLLQGLLAACGESWLRSADFASYDAQRSYLQLQSLASKFDRESVIDLCFAYVRSQPWIHSVVVGCDNLQQVDENLRLFCLPHLSAEECEELEWSLPKAPPSLLNPSQWELRREHAAS